MTEKHAYLLISDLHDTYRKKENRVDYQTEIKLVKEYVIKLIQKYRKDNTKVYLIFMGDVFDTGYKEVFSSTTANNFFIFLRNICDGIYLLFGNHELTYYSGNPIYTLFRTISSKKIQRVQNKMWKPQGIFETFHVVDEICDGDTIIHFNHYGTNISKAVDGYVNIALFHQDVVCSEILDDMQRHLHRTLYGSHPINFEQSDIFEGIHYNFFGHLHSVYGEWKLISDKTGWETRLEYLASLGRPNYTEVHDDFLERDIPAIVLEDGRFVGIEHNRFLLKSYAESVREDVVKKNKERYEAVKERKEIRNYDPLSDEPVKNLLERCTSSEQQKMMMELLMTGGAIYEQGLKNRIAKAMEV